MSKRKIDEPMADEADMGQSKQRGDEETTNNDNDGNDDTTGNVHLNPNDWDCPNCNDHVFASRSACRKCNTPRPSELGAIPSREASYKNPNDWTCSCGDHVFASRAHCRKCGAHRPGSNPGWNNNMGGFNPNMNNPMMMNQFGPAWGNQFGGDMSGFGGMGGFGGNQNKGNMRPGDWLCPSCTSHNYASRTECFKCRVPRPMNQGGMHHHGGQNQQRAGDWNCGQCYFHNYASRTECFKCKASKPSGGQFDNNNMAGQQQNNGGGVPLGNYGAGDQSNSSGYNVGAGNGITQGLGYDASFSGAAVGNGQNPGYGAPSANGYGSSTGNVQSGYAGMTGGGGGGNAAAAAGGGGGNFANAGGIQGSANGYGQGQYKNASDWTCPNCNDHVFASRTQCRKCNTPKPATAL